MFADHRRSLLLDLWLGAEGFCGEGGISEPALSAEGRDHRGGGGCRDYLWCRHPGKKRFIVTTDTGARWLYRAEVIFKVLPGQIGPAFKITSVDPFLISGPPED